MGHAAPVRGGQGGAHAGGDPSRSDRGQRSPIGQHAAQAGPLHQLGDHKPDPGVVPDPMDGGDVGMGEAGRGLGLTFEPLQERLVACQPVAWDLEGDVPMLTPVPGLQHPGHGAAADGPADLIAVAEYLRGHGRRPYQTRPHDGRTSQRDGIHPDSGTLGATSLGECDRFRLG